MPSDYVYHSDFWFEEPEESNPFAAKASYCHGYDVYGQVIAKAGWFEYLLLMFMGERPRPDEAVLLEKLALVLANQGPKEASIRAAMNGGVAATNHSSALMSALAVGSGLYGGSQELEICIRLWEECGQDVDRWKSRLQAPEEDERADIWPAIEHPPGFDPNGDQILMLRLPGAAVHALEQRKMGWKKFPFYSSAIELEDDPGPFKQRDEEGGR